MSDDLRILLAAAAQVPLDHIPIGVPLAHMARAAGYRLRRVKPDDLQLAYLTHPLIAVTGQDRPIAILPTARGSLWIEAHQQPRPCQAADLASLQAEVFALYAILPPHPLTLTHVMRFVGNRIHHERNQLIGVALGAAAMSLLIPAMTAALFETAIPLQDYHQWRVVALLLLIGTGVLAAFQLARGLLTLRIQGRLRDEVTFALWDRFLSLSPAFVRQFAAGDLVERINGLETLQTLYVNSLVTVFLAGMLCLFNGCFMLLIDTRLALLAALLTAAALIISVLIGMLQVRFIRQAVHLQGDTAAYTLQILNGLAKLKAGGALDRAYAQWLERIDQQRGVTVQARYLSALGTTFNGSYPILAALIIFMFIGQVAPLSPAQFVAFNVSYTQFLLTALQLAGIVIEGLAARPVYERLTPLLAEPIEHTQGRQRLEPLHGHIQVEGVSFAYGTRRTLNSISLEIPAGSFVALVGAYGSGKSTLLRLLLGFDTPESGTIAYDGVSLADLDLDSLRHQWGVVLQNGQVLAGDLYQNINIFGQLSLDEAWDAARMAGLAADIEAMPMGLLTYVGEGGGNLSGGQRQRLMLARALAAKPRILFLDEATSALDEQTQAEVMAHLAQLSMTRFVIAHRLSTIQQADYIYVLDQGMIVEHGTFETLLAHNGVFTRLAQAKMA